MECYRCKVGIGTAMRLWCGGYSVVSESMRATAEGELRLFSHEKVLDLG